VSVYGRRTKSAYRPWEADPAYADNGHILAWWTGQHDAAVADLIKSERWNWPWHITDKLVSITAREIVARWRAEDPKCRRYAWYNVLVYFAIARADRLGLTKSIRRPEWKVCTLCDKRFVEDSLPGPFIDRLGIDQLDFCSPCMEEAVYARGNKRATEANVLTYVRDLRDALQRVPSQDYGLGKRDLHGIATADRLRLLRILQLKPDVRRVKRLFGSWLAALIKAGVLDGNARQTGFGTQCLARDGHVPLSAEFPLDFAPQPVTA